MPDGTYRRNFWVLTADGVLYFLGMIFISFESVLPVFLSRLGASRIAIGLVPVALAFGMNIPNLFAAPIVERAQRKRALVLKIQVWQRIPWVVVAVLTPLLAVRHTSVLIPVVLLSVLVATIAGGFVVPAFFHLVATTIPVERRGTLFAFRSVLSYLLGIAGGLVVRVIIERVAFPVNYGVLYGIAALVHFVGMYAFSLIREVPTEITQEQEHRPRVRLRDRISAVLGRDRNFRRYVIMRGFLVLAFATTSFFPIYLIEQFGLPDSVSGIFAMITAATFVAINPIFGRVGDRVGYKPLFIVSFASLGLAACVGLLHATPPFVYVLIALTAVSQSVNMLAWNMTVEFAPDGQIPNYIGVSGFFMGLVAPFAVLTGLIVDRFGYGALFWTAAVFAVAGMLVMVFGVEEPRVTNRRINQPDVPI